MRVTCITFHTREVTLHVAPRQSCFEHLESYCCAWAFYMRRRCMLWNARVAQGFRECATSTCLCVTGFNHNPYHAGMQCSILGAGQRVPLDFLSSSIVDSCQCACRCGHCGHAKRDVRVKGAHLGTRACAPEHRRSSIGSAVLHAAFRGVAMHAPAETMAGAANA